MNKITYRLFIIVIGICVLFVGMRYKSLDAEQPISLGQDSFGEVTIELSYEDESVTLAGFDVIGLSQTLLQKLDSQLLSADEWQQIYPITLVDERLKALQQPMLGTYRIKEGAVRFVPRFPLVPGQVYKAELSFDVMGVLLPSLIDDISAELYNKTVMAEFSLPPLEATATEVIAIYPTAEQLPENLLRFYIYFSAPMRDGLALEQIQLIDAQGREVEGVFFDPVFELWDPSRRRLTLLFDPGRVKTGLRAHEQLGRALIPGQSYTLLIDQAMLDANGNPLPQSYKKTFTVTEADLTPPDVANWQITVPPADTIDPLIVHFPGSLDHGLLTEFIRVQATNGEILPGKIKLDEYETVWQFTPKESWQAGAYEVTVNTRLEDIAGNNLHGLFDRPPEEDWMFLDKETMAVPFRVDN